MKSNSTLELSAAALRSNISFLRTMLGEECILSSVVKGNAYGHGIEVYTPLALKSGIKHFSVFNAVEAERVLRATEGQAEIMIMGLIDNADLEWAIVNNISFFVFDFERLQATLATAKRLKRAARIHIELETGFNRTGFGRNDLQAVADLILQNGEHLNAEGVCTHYAGAESVSNYLRVRNQIRTYGEYVQILADAGVKPRLRHTACSAAAITYPETRMDLVRIGIAQYGFWPSRETLIGYLTSNKNTEDPLRRVITWKSNVMTTKTVRAGEFVGYGTTFLAERDMSIAIIPVGYSEGFSRSLSNQGRVLIKGHRIGVIGKVNMNMLVADISSIPDTQPGDEVILIGNQQDLSISVSSFSELSEQLNYELLTRLPQDIPRTVIG